MISLFKIGILTASDRCSKGIRKDESGELLKELAGSLSAEVLAYEILPDDKVILKEALCKMAKSCDLILTTGGTGLSPRDQTPEATREIIEKEIPGIPEALRASGSKKTPFAILSRGVAGIRGGALIINLPGNPQAVRDAFVILKPILPHMIDLMKGTVSDCPTSFHSLHLHS